MEKLPAVPEKLSSLIQTSTIEIYPDKNTLSILQTGILKSHNIAVTASPSKPIETGIEIAVQLAGLGYDLTPHLSARNIEDIFHLEKILKSLQNNKITKIFVIGGDRKSPLGIYKESLSLLDDIQNIGIPFENIGIAAYPEGYELIPNSTLESALIKKQEFAKKNNINMHMVTQMCFSPVTFEYWLKIQREKGLTLPVVYGSAGPAHLSTIARFAARIGFTESANFLNKIKFAKEIAKNTVLRYDPLDFLNNLEHPELISGMRLFTFNDLAGTESWIKDVLANKKPGQGNQSPTGPHIRTKQRSSQSTSVP